MGYLYSFRMLPHKILINCEKEEEYTKKKPGRYHLSKVT